MGLFRNPKLCALLSISAIVGFSPAAQASRPVPYAVVGCISNGAFNSGDVKSDPLDNPAFKAAEGKTVRVEGYLFPGDSFRATGIFVIDNQCRVESHKRYFLCSPCATMPGMKQKLLPKQPGRKLKLPAEAIEEFNNLGEWMHR